MRIYEYDNGIYPMTLCVVKDATFEEVSSMFTDHEGKPLAMEDYDNANAAVTRALKDDYKTSLIWLIKDIDVGIIAHECAHVANMIFEEIGCAVPSWGNDEPYCYLLQWLVNKTHEAWQD